MIPHAGSMCLLDGVLRWDEVSLRCVSRRFRDPDNPMRRADGTLGAASGIEIAAQAMAVHGSLVGGKGAPPARAYLASLRDVRLRTQALDAVAGALIVDAERLMENEDGAVYRFAVAGGGEELIRGRATVRFAAAR